MNREHSLRTAAGLLREVRSSLNLASVKCGECGLTHYEDKNDWHAASALDGAIGRIEKLVLSMSRNATKENGDKESEAG